ncbi:MAG TPA: hypothetical protein VNO21_27920, partial [Polyangiaceae bacterium]|nr:hypothetical protein [Polyangiaceae bacterium]
MPRKVPQHAGLEVLQERTRAALAALASGFRTESDCEPKVLYDALVGVIVRIVFLFLAGELASVESTWEELVAAFRRLDGEMAERDRLLHAFPFVAEATVEDGVAGEVLRALFYVDRASADVEHLGTVYESMMGYGIEVAREPSLGVVCRRKAGDSQVGALVGLASLLALAGPERRAALEGMDIEITERIGAAVERSASIEQLARALRTRTAPQTPSILPAGARALTSTPDRRRSGSHYTPRALGDRVVEDALGPLLDALGANPSPEEVLRLKVCDPAMGSGAFLLAACRFLGERLVRSWQHRGE